MAGSAVTTLGMRLLSLMGVGSSTRQDAACMLVLGMGIGVSCRCWSSSCRTVCRTANWARQPLVRHRLWSVYGRPLAGKSPLNHYQLVISVDAGERVCSAVLDRRSVKRGWGTNVSLDNRGSASPGSILLGRPDARDSAPARLAEADY